MKKVLLTALITLFGLGSLRAEAKTYVYYLVGFPVNFQTPGVLLFGSYLKKLMKKGIEKETLPGSGEILTKPADIEYKAIHNKKGQPDSTFGKIFARLRARLCRLRNTNESRSLQPAEDRKLSPGNG